MGSSFGLKIINIEKSPLFSNFSFKSEKNRILPFIYFIIKINNFYIQNFQRNQPVSNFTLLNVLTQKEDIISIEKMKSEDFLEGLEYEIKELPTIKQILLISNIISGSLSDACDIKKEETVLLGNSKKYFSSIKEIEQDVKEGKEEFVFYNFKTSTVDVINFNLKKKENNMEGKSFGFEIQEILIEHFFQFYYFKKEEDKKESNIGVIHGISSEEENGEEVNENENENEKEEEEKKNEENNDIGDNKKDNDNEEVRDIMQNKEESEEEKKLLSLNDILKDEDQKLKEINDIIQEEKTDMSMPISKNFNMIINKEIEEGSEDIKESKEIKNAIENEEEKGKIEEKKDKEDILVVKEKYKKDLSIYSKINPSFNYIHNEKGNNYKYIYSTQNSSLNENNNIILIKSVALLPAASPFEIYKNIKLQNF